MIKAVLYNFKTDERMEFNCLLHEIEKGYYKFYLSKSEIKYIPSYDWIVDLIYPFELNFEPESK